MNQQAMLRKIKQLQKEMIDTQREIEETEFYGSSNLVKVTILGNKQIIKVVIDPSFEISDEEDAEMLSDMIVAACNVAYKEIEKVTEEKMGKYSAMMGGFGGLM